MNIEKRFSPAQAMSHKFFNPTATKAVAPKFTAVVKPMMKRGTVRR
jgi:hypothetical protein